MVHRRDVQCPDATPGRRVPVSYRLRRGVSRAKDRGQPRWTEETGARVIPGRREVERSYAAASGDPGTRDCRRRRLVDRIGGPRTNECGAFCPGSAVVRQRPVAEGRHAYAYEVL